MDGNDVLKIILHHPMTWQKFEQLVVDILRADDLPAIHRIGGQGDFGSDAEHYAYYRAAPPRRVVIQITQQKTQARKLCDTIDRLLKFSEPNFHLIMVYADVVTQQTRKSMQEAAAVKGVEVQIRDENYIIGELSKEDNGVFKKHFGSACEYIDRLLQKDTSFGIPSKELERGILATACAIEKYGSDFRLAATDQIVLATVCTFADGNCSETELCLKINGGFPTISRSQINECVVRLCAKKMIDRNSGIIRARSAIRTKVAAEIVVQERAFEVMITEVTSMCRGAAKFDEGSLGRAERNLRLCVTQLVRSVGPIQEEKVTTALAEQIDRFDDDLSTTISSGLDRSQTSAIWSALVDYIRDPKNSSQLATFVRAYAILSACQLDPLGQKYAKKYLSDRMVYLDTDVLIDALIEEIPEHKPTIEALRHIRDSGSRLIATEAVVAEVATHFEISIKTFRALPELKRYPSALADLKIKNALVRGFYYSSKHGASSSEFLQYRSNYFDKKNSVKFVIDHIEYLELGIEVRNVGPQLLSEEDRYAFQRISVALRDRKEKLRRKAKYRSYDEMEERAETDAFLAVLASQASSVYSGKKAKSGLVASDDSAFSYVRVLDDWLDRPLIHLRRKLLPTVLWLLNKKVSDYSLSQALWSSVSAIAGSELAENVSELARIGVDLRRVHLTKLATDIDSNIGKMLGVEAKNARSGQPKASTFRAIREIHRALQKAGYEIDADFGRFVADIDDSNRDAEAARRERVDVRRLVQSLLESSNATARYRRRIRHAIRAVGLEDVMRELENGTSNPVED